MRTPYKVPTELQSFVTGEVLDMHARWQDVTEAEVAQRMNESIHVVKTGDRNVRLGIIGKNQDGPSLVLGLPHQQRLQKVPMWLRAEMVHELVNPDGRTFVLPNNGLTGDYYAFTKDERCALNEGDSRPFGEMWARALEKKKVGKAAVTGYSLGLLTGLSIAGVRPNFGITHLDGNDGPSKAGRTPAELQSDFLHSGGFNDQLAAIEDADIPVLSTAYSPMRLRLDYARYGVAMANPDNRALHKAMAGSREEQVAKVLDNYPDAVIKLGYVAGSKLFDPNSIRYPLRKQEYTGPGTHGHPTGDNPVVHALMVFDGVGRLKA